MWFMYVLSWLSLFVQVAFITLAVGESADPGRAAHAPAPRVANRCCALQLGAGDPELVPLDLGGTLRRGYVVPETHSCSRDPGLPPLPVPSS